MKQKDIDELLESVKEGILRGAQKPSRSFGFATRVKELRMKLGMLAGILGDVAGHLKLTKEELVRELAL